MFFSEKKKARTAQLLCSLEKRIVALEQELKPFRVGKVNWHYPSVDPRPKVSLREAIGLILDHLELELKQTPATNAVIMLEKQEKKKYI
jgi:hypothetical protein